MLSYCLVFSFREKKNIRKKRKKVKKKTTKLHRPSYGVQYRHRGGEAGNASEAFNVRSNEAAKSEI